MAGSVIDLNDPAVLVPNPIVVDTNVLYEIISASFGSPTPGANAARALDFERRMRRAGATGVVVPAVQTELLHLLVRLVYATELTRNGAAIVRRYGRRLDWRTLFKRDPSILQARQADFAKLEQLLLIQDFYPLEPEELVPIHSGRSSHQEQVNTMFRFGLDSADAMLLVEASRMGIAAVATFDPDLLRARADFDVYTWL